VNFQELIFSCINILCSFQDNLNRDIEELTSFIYSNIEIWSSEGEIKPCEVNKGQEMIFLGHKDDDSLIMIAKMLDFRRYYQFENRRNV